VKRPLKLVLWAVGLLVSMAVILILCIGLLFCGDHVTQKVESPSGKYTAQVEESDCGALSGFDTDVMIRQKPLWLSNPHFGRGADLFNLSDSPTRVTIKWKDDRELDIECRGCSEKDSRLFLRSWKDVTIHYTFLPDDQK
jgi:hypothetical protein